MIVMHRVSTAKFTDKPGGDFDTQLTILWLTEGEVMICDLNGSFDRDKHHNLMQYLREHGIKKYIYQRRRNGRWCVYKRKVRI